MSNQKESGVRWFFNLVGVLAPAIILIFIWLPLIAHYFVANVSLTEDLIDSARHVPTNYVLDEIQRFFDSNKIKDKSKLIASAEMVLQGKIAIPGISSSGFGFPFDAEDLDKKRPGWQLFFARFSIPYVLLSAYEVSGRDDFLMAAKDVILGFASYERSAWLPKGLIWNDHAIAGRIPVMAKFWKLYRNHPDYQPEVARDLFQLVARSAKLLAKPANFTFATNHGVMQNLALLQICLAFPSVPNIDLYKHLAFERMSDQMRYYVNDEGVVLEHSAGYHKVGLKFIEIAFKYLTLLEMPIPEDWKTKYQKAEAFYAQLLRPDGSMPLIGDTRYIQRVPGRLGKGRIEKGKNEGDEDRKQLVLKRTHSLYPVAGYSIWWNGLEEWPNEDELSQMVVSWSYFPGHAHKHADEMSVLLWDSGYNWWTNVGYWPYGTRGRSEAISWAGSNAPHLTNESTQSIRNTRLISYAWSDSLAAIDLKRKGPDEYIASRQVLKVKENLWIILDSTSGKEGSRTTTTWTAPPEVKLHEMKTPGSYNLSVEGNDKVLATYIIGSAGTRIRTFQGNLEPFAGWVQRISATSIVIEQPANDSWAAAIWLLQKQDEKSQTFNGTPFMKVWRSPQNWRIGLPFASGLMSIWREDNLLFFQEDETGTGTRGKIILSKPPQISEKIKDIQLAYNNAAREYSPQKYSLPRHLKATYLILFVFLLQEIFFFLYKKAAWRYSRGLRVLSLVGWLAIGLWVSYRIYYFN